MISEPTPYRSPNKMKDEFRAGWLIVAAALIGVIPGQIPIHAMGFFMPIWQAEFGWSRTEIATSISIFTIVTACMSPVIGRWSDRYGPAMITSISIALIVPAWMCLTLIGGSIFTLYGCYFLLGVVTSGSTSVPFARAIIVHFDKARGLALGVSQCATAVVIVLTPIFVHNLLGVFSWQQTVYCLMILPPIVVPFVYYALKSPGHLKQGAKKDLSNEPGYTFREALRTRRLWLFAFSFCLFFFGTAGIIGQIVPILTAMGLSEQNAVTLQVVMGVSVGVGRLGSGRLLDKVFASHLYLFVGLVGAAGFAILATGLMPLAWLAVIFIGIAIGAELDISSYMVSRYFGSRHFGAIFGFVYGAYAAGGIISHPFYGAIYDSFGSYVFATGTSIVAIIIATLMLSRQPPYPNLSSLSSR